MDKLFWCFFFSLLAGCGSYKVPTEQGNHPANADIFTPQIELTPILFIHDAALVEPIKQTEPAIHH
jgi:hypothetical protein